MVLVDEVAFLTAYQPDRKLRERVMNALATLTTQGRAVGYCVIAALQDPRKEVMSIRNLFPDRIAMRLDEPEQVDMVISAGHDALRNSSVLRSFVASLGGAPRPPSLPLPAPGPTSQGRSPQGATSASAQ